MDAWERLDSKFDVTTCAPRAPGVGSPVSAFEALQGAGPNLDRETVAPLLVAVNDPDRATRTSEALAALRRHLPARPFEVVVATGTHRHDAARRETHDTMIRSAAGPLCSVSWHDAAETVDVGGVLVNPRLAAAPDIVAIGSVEPHWFAGLTGAHKTVAVGLLGRASIERSHRLATEAGARPTRLEGNPVHRVIACDLATVSAGRRVLALAHLGAHWAAGQPLDVLERFLGPVRARWVHTVASPLDFVIAHVDAPLDRSLYQAEKGLKLSEDAVADGGVVVIDARCPDGVGPRRFVELLARAPDEAAARARVASDGYRLGDHKAIRWRAVQARGVRLGLVAPGFPSGDARVAGLTVLQDPADAVRFVETRVPSGARGARVRDAAHTVLELAA